MNDDCTRLARRHVRFGWWALLAFLSLGFVLEALHGFKVGWYLDATNETRRMMWTLAHAHGTLLALIQLGFAASLRAAPDASQRRRRAASWALLSANVVLPAGFFLGGAWIYGGDPGLGVFLVPVGAILLFAGVLLAALGATSSRAE